MQGAGMKISLGIVAGITLTILAYAMKQPTLDMIFYQDQPRDPEGHEPKMRTCHDGTWTDGPWNA